METVRQLLEKKGNIVWSVEPDTTVYEAIELMSEKEIGALLVMDGGKVLGVLSERDYARHVILKGRSSKTTRVREIMSERVVYALPEQTVEECMALMTDKRIRHLPVMDGDKLAGLISMGDLVKSIIATQRFVIEQLANYISR